MIDNLQKDASDVARWENEGGALEKGKPLRDTLDAYATLYYPDELQKVKAAQEAVEIDTTKRLAREHAEAAQKHQRINSELTQSQQQLQADNEEYAQKSAVKDLIAHKRVRFLQVRIDASATDPRMSPELFEEQEDKEATAIFQSIDQEALGQFMEQAKIQDLQEQNPDPQALFTALEDTFSQLKNVGIGLSQKEWSTVCSFLVRANINQDISTLTEKAAMYRQRADHLRTRVTELVQELHAAEQQLNTASEATSDLPETRAFYDRIQAELSKDLELSTIEAVIKKYNVVFFQGLRDDRGSFVDMIAKGRQGAPYSISTLRAGDTAENAYKAMGLIFTKGQIHDAFKRDVTSDISGGKRIPYNVSADVSHGTARLPEQIAAAEGDREGEGGERKFNEYLVGSEDFLGEEQGPMEIGGIMMFIDEYPDDEKKNEVYNMNAHPDRVTKAVKEANTNNVPLYVWKEGKMYKGEYDAVTQKLRPVGDEVKPVALIGKKVQVPPKVS